MNTKLNNTLSEFSKEIKDEAHINQTNNNNNNNEGNKKIHEKKAKNLE